MLSNEMEVLVFDEEFEVGERNGVFFETAFIAGKEFPADFGGGTQKREVVGLESY